MQEITINFEPLVQWLLGAWEWACGGEFGIVGTIIWYVTLSIITAICRGHYIHEVRNDMPKWVRTRKVIGAGFTWPVWVPVFVVMSIAYGLFKLMAMTPKALFKGVRGVVKAEVQWARIKRGQVEVLGKECIHPEPEEPSESSVHLHPLFLSVAGLDLDGRWEPGSFWYYVPGATYLVYDPQNHTVQWFKVPKEARDTDRMAIKQRLKDMMACRVECGMYVRTTRMQTPAHCDLIRLHDHTGYHVAWERNAGDNTQWEVKWFRGAEEPKEPKEPEKPKEPKAPKAPIRLHTLFDEVGDLDLGKRIWNDGMGWRYNPGNVFLVYDPNHRSVSWFKVPENIPRVNRDLKEGLKGLRVMYVSGHLTFNFTHEAPVWHHNATYFYKDTGFNVRVEQNLLPPTLDPFEPKPLLYGVNGLDTEDWPPSHFWSFMEGHTYLLYDESKGTIDWVHIPEGEGKQPQLRDRFSEYCVCRSNWRRTYRYTGPCPRSKREWFNDFQKVTGYKVKTDCCENTIGIVKEAK